MTEPQHNAESLSQFMGERRKVATFSPLSLPALADETEDPLERLENENDRLKFRDLALTGTCFEDETGKRIDPAAIRPA